MVQSAHLSSDFRLVRSHVEDLLDEALMDTFPASDPVAIEVEEVKFVASRSAGRRASRKKRTARSSETKRRH